MAAIAYNMYYLTNKQMQHNASILDASGMLSPRPSKHCRRDDLPKEQHDRDLLETKAKDRLRECLRFRVKVMRAFKLARI